MENQLSYLNDTDRLNAFNTIIGGCTHVWSKGKIQQDKLNSMLDVFMVLAEKDPGFLAHFNSWIIKESDGKDLKVISTFANSLNDADGTPFSEGSSYRKPNYRKVSAAAIQCLDPKLVNRVVTLANMKMPLGETFREGTHFSKHLKTAVKKYLRYREQNPKIMEGIRKSAFKNTVLNLYRMLHLSPSTEAASILGWDQKDGREIVKKDIFSFEGLTDIQIAEKIREEKLKPQGVLGALTKKISPVIAAAVLEQCSGDQAVIYRELFDKEGLLKNAEVMKVFKSKIKTAKTALDRVDKITTSIDDDVAKELKKARSVRRKEVVGDLGRVYMHIDVSPSMHAALQFAIDRGSIFAECISNPEENFHWGLFADNPYPLPTPETFEKEAFASALYDKRVSGGGTDCIACYKDARSKNCDIDIYITDQEHNCGDIARRIQGYDANYGRPKAVVIVNYSRRGYKLLQDGLEAVGIPVSVIDPETLTESALVAQTVQSALRGAMTVIDAIMSTPLLELPKWYASVDVK